MRQRIQKILAAAGISSRRRAEDLVRAGRVTVDGLPAEIGQQADPARQVVAVDGEPVGSAALEYWLVHKPRGVLTTTDDPQGRPTVVELLPGERPRLYPVGRLDLDTEGLVLCTNDGAVAHALLHPSLGTEREYRVTARGRVGTAALRRLAAGVELDDGRTAPARVGRPRHRAASTTFGLTLREGRKRQIRRALAALGHPVERLVRVRMGPIRLGSLAPGRSRRLTRAEIGRLRRHAAERVQGGPRAATGSGRAARPAKRHPARGKSRRDL